MGLLILTFLKGYNILYFLSILPKFRAVSKSLSPALPFRGGPGRGSSLATLSFGRENNVTIATMSIRYVT
jgi:hypothetical protein